MQKMFFFLKKSSFGQKDEKITIKIAFIKGMSNL